MRIPYANRTADVDLPAKPGQPKVTVKAVIDDFRSQLPSNFTDLFEAFVLLSPRKVRVTCRTPFKLEEVGHLGLTFRESPVTIRPCRSAKWVNVTRLSYGVPNEALEAVLSPYGKVLHVKMDLYKGVYDGVRHVLMEVATPIPSTLRVADHWCNVFYIGQTPTCFACRQVGHTRHVCPNRLVPPAPAVDVVADTAPILLSPARATIVQDVLDSLTEQVSRRASFAEVVRPSLDPDGGPLPLAPVAVPAAQTSVSSKPAAPITDAPPPAPVLAGDLPVQQDGSSSSSVHGSAVVEAPVEVSAAEESESSTSSDDVAFEDVNPAAGDHDEYLEDAQVVTDSFSLKRTRASDSESGSSDSSVSPERKRGKEIARDLHALLGAGDANLLKLATSDPLPSDNDDDDFCTQDPNLDTPISPDIIDEPLSTDPDTDVTDYPLTQTTPLPKPSLAVSQHSDSGFSPFLRTRTTPGPVVGTSRIFRAHSQARRFTDDQ